MALVAPERLLACETRWCAGAPSREIERELSKKYGVGKRTIRNYLQKVKKRLGIVFANEDKNAVRLRTETMLQETYQKAKEEGNVRVMMDAAMRLSEIHGATSTRLDFAGGVKVSGLGDLLTSAAAEQVKK